ncbi:MAG: ATP-binding protein [Pseudobacteriovorax sp.]|nr:ATP-binding protein [Pseudobacteriovorax sp.]
MLICLSGSPGTGKTTLLNEMAQSFPVVAEPARQIIAEQRAIDGDALWDKSPYLFIQLILSRHMSAFNEARHRTSDRLVLFDRGVTDCIAYASQASIDTDAFSRAARHYRYDLRVFYCPLWHEIYCQDDERTMSFGMTKIMDQQLRDAYRKQGYDLIEVPKLPIKERALWLKSQLNLISES